MESCEKSVSEGIQKEDVTLEPIGQPIVEKNDDVAEKYVPGQVSMTGGVLSYADAMGEANSSTHKTYLDTFNEGNVAEGYIGTFNEVTGCITVTKK